MSHATRRPDVTTSNSELVELVPNVSEGRDSDAVRSIAEAFASPEGVWLLDVHSDASHNRSVLTAVARPSAVLAAVEALAARVVDRIDLRSQRGIHPRIGALDVVPLVGLGSVSPETLERLARDVASRLGEALSLPVFFYGRLATRKTQRELAGLRRGGYESLGERIASGHLVPDAGPAAPHPTAGATAVAVRDFLIAFNVNLETDDLSIASAIARQVRASSGGLPALQALGFPFEKKGERMAQVSMNLLDFRQTSLLEAYESVAAEAARRGVEVAGSELVGLIPEAASFEGMEARLKLEAPAAILEERLARARAGNDVTSS